MATTILGSDEENTWAGVRSMPGICGTGGSAVYAMASGRVSYAGCNNAGGYGCWVLLKHSGGYDSSYGHCAAGSIRVQAGQTVDANALLCQVGWTGQTSFGPHTHFEIRHGGRFIRIDQFFDIDQMKQCDPCSVQGAPVAAQGITATQTATPTAQNALGRILATMTAEQFATLSTALVTLLMLAWWLSGLYVRVMIVAATTTATVAACIVLLFLPGAPVQAGQQSAAVAGGDTWKAAYSFMRRWRAPGAYMTP